MTIALKARMTPDADLATPEAYEHRINAVRNDHSITLEKRLRRIKMLKEYLAAKWPELTPKAETGVVLNQIDPALLVGKREVLAGYGHVNYNGGF